MSREAGHPDPSTLEAFALGQLETAAMRRVEDHLTLCPACARVAQSVPDDRLVGLLRRREALALLLAPVVASAFLGCSGEPAAVAIDGDKAKTTLGKRFQNSDEKSAPKGPVSRRSD